MRLFLINFFIVSLLLFSVSTAHAASTFIVCDPKPVPGGTANDCDFNDLVQLAKNIINWLIVFSTALAAVVFAFAGFTLLTSGGSEEKMKKAKTMFTKTAIGFIIVLASWLLVSLIINVLLKPDSGYILLG